MAALTLVCSCGMKLNAPGAVPGRVGKCPRCGSLLKVPEPPPAAEAPPRPRTRPRTSGGTFVEVRGFAKQEKPKRGHGDGLVAHPRVPETRLVESLTYPLWNDSGVAILVFLPPLLMITTVPLPGIVRMLASGEAATMVGILWALPLFFLFAIVAGYVLLWLGRVLVSSALGEVAQPRSPAWDLGEIASGLGRWSWALIIGGVGGCVPAVAYWIRCGEVDWFDRIVLLDLIVPGMAYAQMALVASLMHESPLAANPITVIRAIFRAGWGYLSPCLFTGACLVFLAAMLGVVARVADPLGQFVGVWAFAVASLYLSTVVARRVGVFFFHRSVVFQWFPNQIRRSL